MMGEYSDEFVLKISFPKLSSKLKESEQMVTRHLVKNHLTDRHLVDTVTQSTLCWLNDFKLNDKATKITTDHFVGQMSVDQMVFDQKTPKR
jgi:hypothetical protein